MKDRLETKTMKKKNLVIQYLQDYRFNSILVKSFLLILVLLCCSFLGIMLAVSNKTSRYIEEQVGTMSISSLQKTKNRIDTIMREVVQVSGQLSLDHEVLMYLLPDTKELLNKNQTRAIKDKLASYAGVLDYVDSIYLYSVKNKYIVTNENGFGIQEFKDHSWYDNLMEREYEPSRMISRLKEDNYPYLVTYLQPIRLTQMQFLGGIIVNIDAARLDDLVISSGNTAGENFFIADNRNNIIFSSDRKFFKKKINTVGFYNNVDFKYKEGYQIVNDGSQDLVVSVEASDNFKWKYISAIPLSAYKEYQNGFREFYLLLIAVLLLIALCAAFGISLYGYMPVKNILDLLKNPDIYVEGLNENTGLERDETKEITLNIIRNLYSNKQMQSELQNYLNVVQKAQVTALQAQISPHFLYNTLDNIRWKAIDICKGDNEVAQIILNLSEILRISLNHVEQMITIEEEIRIARLYIEILQLRYEGRIQVNWDIDEEALKHSIVKLSLQPIIENAVYHGVKPLRETGIIGILVKKEEIGIRIEISDNGNGINPEEADTLNRDMNEKYKMKEGHIGIRNVNQRLKLLMGDEAGLEIRTHEWAGTTVIFKLPLAICESALAVTVPATAPAQRMEEI